MSINTSYSYTSGRITKRHLAERGGEIKDTVVLREASPCNSCVKRALFFGSMAKLSPSLSRSNGDYKLNLKSFRIEF